MQPLEHTQTRPLWKRISPLLGAHFVNDYFGNVLPVLLPLLQAKFGLTLAMVGLVSSAHVLSSSLTQLLFGWMGDRARRVNFILWGPAITGVFLSVSGLMPGFGALLATVIVAGLGSAMFHPQGSATAGELVQRRRGLSISLFISSGRIGASLSPIITGLLFGTVGLIAGSLTSLVFVVLAVALLAWTLPPPAHPPQRQRPPLWEVFRPLIPLWLIVVCRHVIYMSFITYLMFLLQERDLSFEAASFGLFLFLVGGALGSLVGGPISDRVGRKRVVIVTLLLAAPCLWLFLHTEGWVSFVWLAVGGTLLIANNPVIVAHAQELVPSHAATASAVTMGLGWGASALLISPVGVLGDQWGVDVALNWVLLATVVAVPLAFWLPQPKVEQPG